MSADVYALLTQELGASRVLRDDRIEPYLRDESGLGRFPAEAAVLCETREEVAHVLELARAHKIAVTPRGLGSGLTGGCLPVRGGIVLSTERMKKIVEIDDDDLIAVVEPGVITEELHQAVEARGLFYPPDPASLSIGTIGGNVAENAGGPRAFKYGTTREYTIGMEFVQMGGAVTRAGRRTAKGVTGYDVVAAMVGSEGTFAVSTEITVKLLPKPPAVATLLAVFADLVVAGNCVTALIRDGELPRALELMDRSTIEHLRGKTPYHLPVGAGAVLLIELDGAPEGIEARAERCALTCEKSGAVDVQLARDDKQRRDLWETRRRANPILTQSHARKIPEDIVVPRGAIPEMLRRADEIAADTGVAMATYGHAGDGNLHINLLVDTPPEDVEKEARVTEALERVFRATLDLRGTLAGEHGVGLLKQKYVPWEQSSSLIQLQRQMKKVFDPEDLLNPGKMFPAP